MDYLWGGSEEDFGAMISAKVKTEGMLARGESMSMDKAPSLYSRQGSVGIVDIKGTLVSGDAGFMSIFGFTGYDNVRQALVQAANDKQAISIMLNIDSSGGSVNGCMDTSEFIKTISQIKPVTAYADNANSAAYWIGSSAGHITAGRTSLVGSIGILRIHTETSKADEKEGITRTVMRAGKYKALLNPIEPLTQVAKDQTQAMLDELYSAFVNDVATNRGVTYAMADENMAQGRVFLGTQALAAGLIDKVGNYEQALAHASTLASLRNGANRGTNATNGIAKASLSDNNTGIQTEGTAVKPTLTEEQMLAISAGINLEGDAPTPEAEAAANTDVETVDVAAENETLKAEVTTLSGEIETVKADLAAAQEQLTGALASVELGKQAAIEAGESTKALAAIVSASTKLMLVALGGKTEGIDAMSPTDLLAKHTEVVSAYHNKFKFKAGGVAATSANTEEPKVVKSPKASLFAAFLQSASVK